MLFLFEENETKRIFISIFQFIKQKSNDSQWNYSSFGMVDCKHQNIQFETILATKKSNLPVSAFEKVFQLFFIELAAVSVSSKFGEKGKFRISFLSKFLKEVNFHYSNLNRKNCWLFSFYSNRLVWISSGKKQSHQQVERNELIERPQFPAPQLFHNNTILIS